MAAKKSNNIALPVFLSVVGVVIALLVYFYEPSHNWNVTLRTNTEGPYDLHLFKALVDSSTTEKIEVTEEAITQLLDTINDVNYFFVGNYPYLDSADTEVLFDFVERGNSAFIVSNEFSEALYGALTRRELWIGNQDWTYSEKVFPRTFQKRKEHDYAYHGPSGYNDRWWAYMDSRPININPPKKVTPALVDQMMTSEDSAMTDDVAKVDTIIRNTFDSLMGELADGTYTVTVTDEDDSTEYINEEEGYVEYYDDYDYDRFEGVDTTGWTYFETLGYYNNKSEGDTVFQNFFRLKWGDGQLLVHVNPIMFTNYYLLNEDGFQYTNEALSYIENKPVLWDGYHHEYRGPDDYYPTEANTPLRFVFDNPPLKYAWLTLVGSTFLFLVFRTKRQQKVIPIIPAVENTSIAFAKSLGVLYHQARSGRFIAIELMRMFDNFNRRHYGLNRNKKDDESAFKISQKSRVSQDLLDEILKLELKIVYNPNSKITEVVNLYNQLEAYYKQAKK